MSERLNVNISLILHKLFVKSIIIYASPTGDFRDTFLKLRRLHNCTIRLSIRLEISCSPHRPTICTWLLKTLYMRDFLTKLCRQQTEVKQNTRNKMLATWEEVKIHTGKISGLNMAAGMPATPLVTKLLIYR